MKKMERSRQNSVYIVFENGEVMGPLETGRGAKKQDSFDEKFYRAATETGLSVNTIYKIFGGIVKEEKADFTSRELAAICWGKCTNHGSNHSEIVRCGLL